MRLLVDLYRFIQYGDLPTSYFVKRGMKVGKNFCRQSGTRMDPSHCWLINIGDDVTLANKVQILAHDDSIRVYTGYGRIGTVTIGDRVFVGANSTILMNTKIGNDVIIGAGSVVTKDIPDGSIAAGIPAKVIGNTYDFIERERAKMNNTNVFDKSFSHENNVTRLKKRQLLESLSNNAAIGYLELGQFSDQ